MVLRLWAHALVGARDPNSGPHQWQAFLLTKYLPHREESILSVSLLFCLFTLRTVSRWHASRLEAWLILWEGTAGMIEPVLDGITHPLEEPQSFLITTHTNGFMVWTFIIFSSACISVHPNWYSQTEMLVFSAVQAKRSHKVSNHHNTYR